MSSTSSQLLTLPAPFYARHSEDEIIVNLKNASDSDLSIDLSLQDVKVDPKNEVLAEKGEIWERLEDEVLPDKVLVP
jgi:hypothetical protein